MSETLVIAYATCTIENEFRVVLSTGETDINAAYEEAIHVLSSKARKTERKPDSVTEQEDYYKTFRTNVLLVWTLSSVSDDLFEPY